VQDYREDLGELARAEGYGFDGIFVNGHHFTASNNDPDCKLTAAFLIDRTKNCHIGVDSSLLTAG